MTRVVVVGAGTMGAGIAQAVAAAGLAVDLVEVDAQMRARAQERLSADADRITLHESIDRVGGADIAIEAVPESLALKQQVFLQLERALGPHAVLATNTSSLCVGDIAEVLSRPDRALGLHFFNPPQRMPLVEVVRAAHTSADAIAVATAFAAALGKTAVEVADTPGFIVNRVARPYYLQALHALESSLGSVEDLDGLARGVGFRMGPFELMDFIGLDVNLATSDSIYERTRAARLEPVELQREMVAAGKLGRKSGQGFYGYADGPPARRSAEPPPVPPPNSDEFVVVTGSGLLAGELAEMLGRVYAHVHVAVDDDRAPRSEATVVLDVGDGATDRASFIQAAERELPPEAVILMDAYATDVVQVFERAVHPERIVGFGILGSLDGQTTVEIVDADETSDDALALAEELFAALGKRVTLVAPGPGLFLGRTVASIVNEAIYAVQEGVATAEDVDTAMRLGTNYPLGPIAWGREIGGARIARILLRLAAAEGNAYAPARALWVLDAEDEAEPQPADDPLMNRLG